MSVANFPTPETLAELVNGVTHTMLGLDFELGGENQGPCEEGWEAVALRISEVHDLTVLIAADRASSRQLACAMFDVPSEEVDDAMLVDSLGELTNIVAGQVKIAMGVAEQLGLPEHLSQGDRRRALPKNYRAATLRRGGVQTVVWIAVVEGLGT